MGIICCRPEAVDFDAPVDLWHFYLLRSIGKGNFGKVRVVQHKQTKLLYALKYMNKQRIVKLRGTHNTIQERRLLEEIDHPFVCNLRYAFQDDENLFMVLDLMLGGALRFHLDRIGYFPEEVVKFYVAELALALDYLHKKGIIHRDIKPDNILLDEHGHAHLTDFNIAVHVPQRRLLTSVTGSPAYMAPEILSRKGYHASVDWWSLGVMAFELLFGRRPFRARSNSELTRSILYDPFKIPESKPVEVNPSSEAMSCINGLLEKDPRKRLGCVGTGGIEGLKSHPWFQGIDWDNLELKECSAPFEPDAKKPNFDASHELEELLLEDNPLKAKKRNPKRQLETLSEEMRIMEENFKIYDHTKMQRKSWFALADPSLDNNSTNGNNGSFPAMHDQDHGIPLTEQPFSDVTTRIGMRVSVSRNGNSNPPSSSPAPSLTGKRSTPSIHSQNHPSPNPSPIPSPNPNLNSNSNSHSHSHHDVLPQNSSPSASLLVPPGQSPTTPQYSTPPSPSNPHHPNHPNNNHYPTVS